MRSVFGIRDPFHLALGTPDDLIAEAVGRMVFVPITGQSNSQGAALYDGLGDYPTGVLQYTQTDQLVQATSPLDHHGEIAGTMGLQITFAEAWLADNPTDTLVFLPLSMGGTGFQAGDWGSGNAHFARGTYFDLAIAQINEFAAAYPDAVMGPIIQVLGERDQGEGTLGWQYADELDAEIRAFRSELTAAGVTTPFIACGVTRFPTDPINEAIYALPSRLAYTAAPYAGDLDLGDDDLHLTAPALRTLGQRAYQGYLDAIALTGTAPAAASGLTATADHVRVYLSMDPQAALFPPLKSWTIERREGAGAWSTIATTDYGDGHYVDETVSPSTSYEYRVTPTNDFGSGATSAAVSVTTDAAAGTLAVASYDAAGVSDALVAETDYVFGDLTVDAGLAVIMVAYRGGTTIVDVTHIELGGVEATVAGTITTRAFQKTVIATVPVGGGTLDAVVRLDAVGYVTGLSVWTISGGASATIVTGGQGAASATSPLSDSLATNTGDIVLGQFFTLRDLTATWAAPLSDRAITAYRGDDSRVITADGVAVTTGTTLVEVTPSGTYNNTELAAAVVTAAP